MLILSCKYLKQIDLELFFQLFMNLLNHNLIIIIIFVFLLIYELMAALKVMSLDAVRNQLFLYYLVDFQNVLFGIHMLGILLGNEMNVKFE